MEENSLQVIRARDVSSPRTREFDLIHFQWALSLYERWTRQRRPPLPEDVGNVLRLPSSFEMEAAAL